MNPTTPKRSGRARRGELPEPDQDELASQSFQFEPDGRLAAEPALDEEPPPPPDLRDGASAESASEGRAAATEALAARILANLNAPQAEAVTTT